MRFASVPSSCTVLINSRLAREKHILGDTSTLSSTAAQYLAVEVAYDTVERQNIIALDVEPRCRALVLAEQSGIKEHFPEIDLASAKMGVFSKAVKADEHQLKATDRVESYRPLLADPKAFCKARAEKAKAASGSS